VHEEVVTRGLERQQSDAYAIQLAVARHYLTVVQLATTDLSAAIQALPIHPGEKQAIELALREKPDWLLLDDLLARDHARRMGLKVKGTLGVIVAAYRQRLVNLQEVELIFHAIQNREDIWINDKLIERVWDQLSSEAKGKQ